ncbi:Mov34/MPN/PAD-1 family protein, partial [Tenacibaculum maritimum]
MKLINKHKKVEIIFDENLLSKLCSLGIKNYPNEFGGFLVGRYEKENKLLIIEETILPQKYEGTPNLFLRSSKGIEEQFKKMYREKPSKYYIGEWHTHPNGSTNYSQTDLNAMIN